MLSASLGEVVLSLCVVCVAFLLYYGALRPYRLLSALSAQGVRGLPFRPLIGNVRVVVGYAAPRLQSRRSRPVEQIPEIRSMHSKPEMYKQARAHSPRPRPVVSSASFRARFWLSRRRWLAQRCVFPPLCAQFAGGNICVALVKRAGAEGVHALPRTGGESDGGGRRAHPGHLRRQGCLLRQGCRPTQALTTAGCAALGTRAGRRRPCSPACLWLAGQARD